MKAYKYIETVAIADRDDIECVTVNEAYEGIKIALLEFIEGLEEAQNHNEVLAILRDSKDSLKRKKYINEL